MNEILRRKLNLILWHVQDIGLFVEAHAPFGEFMNRLCHLVTYGVIGKFVVEETTKNLVLVDVEHLTPRETKAKLVPEVLDQLPLHIFPFYKSDACVHLDLADMIERERNSQAFYSANQDCIFLNLDSEETERFMATSLFHETGHALWADEQNRLYTNERRPSTVRIEEELSMWLFDCKLAQILGGSKLRKAMGETATKIAHAHAVGKTYRGQLGMGKPLDACYRPAKSKKAQANRDGAYIIFCALLAAKHLKEPDKILVQQRHVISTHVIGSKYDDEDEMIKKAAAESRP